jgi:tetratricopeptide (TPR) repeat protein
MAGTLWFYVKDDKRLGPVDFEQLVGLLLGGQLPQSALVWHQGLREWASADKIPEIAEQLPPPLPPGKSPKSSTMIIEAPALLRARLAAPEPAPAKPAAPANPRIEELRRRLEKDPNSRLFAQLAEELRKEGDLEEAVRICREGLQKHPFYPSARMTLGRALLDSGDLDAARTEFETVLQAAPDNLLARRFLEESQARRAEPEAAAEQEETGAAVSPLPVSPAPPPSLAVDDTPVEASTDNEIAPPSRPRAEDLPPIPLVAAEEHWELAAPYEVSGRSVAETPSPPAPVEAAPEVPPAPVPAAPEAIRTTPPPVPAGRRRAGANLPDLSTLLAESSVLNAPAMDGSPVEAATPQKPDSAALAADSPAPSETPAHVEVPSTGSLAEYDFPDLLHSLFVRRWTGTIELHRGRVDTSVQVTGGRLVFASSNNKDERLGELLLRRQKITLQQYYDASKAIRKGKRLGSILVEQGALEPKDLVKVVVDHTREVIVSVFLWTEGFYQLKEGPDPGTESITLRLSTPDIIMEGIGRIQAWSRIERGVGGPDARYARADDYQERLREMTLSPEKLLLVGDLGGERDVASICSTTKLSDYEVCRTLWAFRVIGILRLVGGPAAAPPPDSAD